MLICLLAGLMLSFKRPETLRDETAEDGISSEIGEPAGFRPTPGLG